MTATAVVGVDVGSSSARALAVDAGGAVLASASGRYPGSAAWQAGRADPAAWLAGVAEAIAGLRASTPAAERPAAIAIGGQSPTTVPGGGGLAVTCLHPAGSTGSPAEQHAAQWALLRDELGEATEPWQVWDWLLHRLGAPRRSGRWPGDPDLAGYGEPAPTGSVVGEADGTAGIPRGTPLVPAAQDAYLGFWAGGLDTPRRAMDPGGRTGGLGVSVAAGTRPAAVYALASAAPGVDIVGGPTNAHGLALEWWAGVTGRTVGQLLELAGAVPPGAGGVLALPYLSGERAPRWMPELRGAVVGLGTSSGPGEVARALLEGTAYGLGHIAAELARHGVTFDVLVCGGTPGRSRLWCTIKASVLGVPAEVPRHPELAAYGAALAAGAGVGWWPPPGEGGPGSWPRPAYDVVEPERSELYEEGFRRWVALGDDEARRLGPEREERG